MSEDKEKSEDNLIQDGNFQQVPAWPTLYPYQRQALESLISGMRPYIRSGVIPSIPTLDFKSIEIHATTVYSYDEFKQKHLSSELTSIDGAARMREKMDLFFSRYSVQGKLADYLVADDFAHIDESMFFVRPGRAKGRAGRQSRSIPMFFRAHKKTDGGGVHEVCINSNAVSFVAKTSDGCRIHFDAYRFEDMVDDFSEIESRLSEVTGMDIEGADKNPDGTNKDDPEPEPEAQS